MTKEEKNQKYKRARTSSQKAERRDAIIQAAQNHLREAGIDKFSMGVLAKEVGIARATLYLYFETREELLLTLYAEQVTVWGDMLLETIIDDMDDEAFLDAYMTAFKKDPLFFQLLSRLGDVIEQNVSLERLIVSKRLINEIISKLTDHIGKSLHMSQENTMDLLLSLLVLMAGVSQMDSGPHIDPELLPEDLQAMAKVTSEGVYMNAGRLILSGIRSSREETKSE